MIRDLFLEGMSHAAATVSIVTTDGPAGRAGVTVSAMCSITADAPSLLVCVHHMSPASAAIRENGVFCVNVLRDDQSLVSDTFAGRVKTPGGDKFDCADWHTLETGAPALTHPLVTFDCRLKKDFQWGTHFIFVGEVADIAVDARGSALIFANRAYGTPLPLERRPPRAARAAPEELNVGCFLTLGPYFLPGLIARFTEDHSGVDVRVSEGEQHQLMKGLADGDFDLILTYEDGLGADLSREPLAEVSPYVLLAAAHPLAAKPALSLAELAREPMVLLDGPTSRSYFTGLFTAAGQEPNVRFRSTSFETVRGLVGHGLGFTLLATKPANNMTYDGMALVARPLSDEVPPSRIVVARTARSEPTPAAAHFVAHCRALLAEAASEDQGS